MKVMCVKEPGNKISPVTGKPFKVVVGGIYTVVDFFSKNDGWESDGYRLAEDIEHTYNAKFFAPLSDIDEKEMQRELVNVKQLCQ